MDLKFWSELLHFFWNYIHYVWIPYNWRTHGYVVATGLAESRQFPKIAFWIFWMVVSNCNLCRCVAYITCLGSQTLVDFPEISWKNVRGWKISFPNLGPSANIEVVILFFSCYFYILDLTLLHGALISESSPRVTWQKNHIQILRIPGVVQVQGWAIRPWQDLVSCRCLPSFLIFFDWFYSP